MKVRKLIFGGVLVLLAASSASANRQLDKAEILQIFQTLTNQARRTWIPAGTITATHKEYKSSTGYVIDSNVAVKYNGEKFYWEINIVDSHSEQTKPQANQQGNSWQDDVDLSANMRRIFAWDGERYTMYFGPGNYAIVIEYPSDIPVAVNGPLTAGIVPWGYGIYTLESLLAAESSAEVDSQGQVHLTVLMKTDRLTLQMVFVLDPTKNYAVLSQSLSDGGISSIAKTFGDYRLVSGHWIPTTIVIDQHDQREQPPELLSHDEWKLTSVSTRAPSPDSFSVPYATGTLVKYKPSIINKALWYHHSDDIDIDSLLCERLKIVLTGEMREQNCATISMKHVLEDLGKDVDDSDLAALISELNEGTSLYAMKEFAQRLGLHCLAGKTDLATLKNLNGTKAILHLPEDHYAVLAHIDDEYVWLIDLDHNKFFYREKVENFDLDLGETTALLVSKSPLHLSGAFVELTDKQSQQIVGGFPNFSCTKVIQSDKEIHCPPPFNLMCGGCYYNFLEVCGCEPAASGECSGGPMPGYVYVHCYYNDLLTYCVGDGDAYVRLMRGCECDWW